MTTATSWRSRIVDHGEEDPEQLLANPANYRLHPLAQQKGMAEALDAIGWIDEIIVNRRSAHVINGHLRVSLAISRGEKRVPVKYVDLSPEEEAFALATFDPLTYMAGIDKQGLDELIATAREAEVGASALLDRIASDMRLESARSGDKGGPQALPQMWGIVIECADEAQQVALLERFQGEGLECRALL